MERVLFDYSKLSGRIKEKYGSQKAFSDALGVSEATLSSKMTGKTYFTQTEIEKSIDLLCLETGAITSYFFTPRV